MISQYPKFNWVVCHSPYSIGFDGVEGTDYGHTHHELNIAWGRTVGSALLFLFLFFLSHNALNRFDLYWAKSGIFYRHGEGGFINVRMPWVVILKPNNEFIQHSGRIMAT
jgi:hypothetical protein